MSKKTTDKQKLAKAKRAIIDFLVSIEQPKSRGEALALAGEWDGLGLPGLTEALAYNAARLEAAKS